MNEFERLVSAMRDAQKNYFKSRSSDWLVKSKELERRVDAWLVRVNDMQMELGLEVTGLREVK